MRLPSGAPACVLALAAACATSVTHAELDRLLAGRGVETVLREEAYTLWSPYGPADTRPWSEAVAAERAAVLAAFGGDAPVARLQVVLVPFEGVGPTFTVGPHGELVEQGTGVEEARGLRGWSGDDTVTVSVPAARWLERPDGRRAAAVETFDAHVQVLRHELAHWRAYALGIDGPSWLGEGLAQLVEGFVLEDGRLVDRGPPAVDLALARALRVRDLSLASLLDWREDGERIVAIVSQGDVDAELGVERVPRAACALYLRFRLGRNGDGSPVVDLARELRELDRLPRAAHLADEERWSAWLADRLALPRPDADG